MSFSTRLFCFLLCELKLKVLSKSVSLAISTCWRCQNVSSELWFRNLMHTWFCIRFLATLHLSSGWGKLICHKMMQHRRCHMIKELSIWRNIWAPNSRCSISGAKPIQNKVLWQYFGIQTKYFWTFNFFKKSFHWDFLSQIGSVREKFLTLVSSLREIQNNPVISKTEDESEGTCHSVRLAMIFF